MTDLDQFESFLKQFKINYKTVSAQDEYGISTKTTDYGGAITWDCALDVKNGIWYFDFYIRFYFLNNKYQGHGVWE